MTRGIVTGRYMKFISKTLDEMDNAPIYTLGDITRLIEARGYRVMSLPPYSPELNPIENFWSVVKNSVKRSAFQKTEDLKTRISEVSECISRKTLHNIAQHSVENFRRCFDKESL